MTLPNDAYVTIRGLPDGWLAVVAVRGHVLYRAKCDERAEAFKIAEEVAERAELPCLVRRGAS
jgi:hypothetical protein